MTTRVSARYNSLADLCLWLVGAARRLDFGYQKGRNGSGPGSASRQRRQYSQFREDVIVVLFLIGYLLAALVTNLYVLPENELISGLYAISVLIAAHRSSPLAVALTDALAVAFYLYNAAVKGAPPGTQELSVFALLMVGYLSVVTARQRMEAVQQAKEFKEAQQQLQQFLAMISHDLDQPLTILSGHVQILGNSTGGELPAAKQRSLATVREMTHRIRRLVDDVEDTSHIGSNRFKVRPELMDLVALANQIVAEQRPTSGKHALVLEAPPSLQGWWDRDRLSQLLTNLISNAIRYSPEGGEVRVAIQPLDDTVILSVSDHGIGIPIEQQKFLFRPFSRLEGAKTRKGTGLGLYISKAIVEAHNGQLWVESGKGNETSFYVSLPIGHGVAQDSDHHDILQEAS